MKRSLWSKLKERLGRTRMMFCAIGIPVALVGAFAVGDVFHAKESHENKPGHGEAAGRSITEPIAVHLVKPEVRNIVRVVGQPSFVEAYERTSIFPKMTAYIKKWNVDIGDKVKKDEVLATLFVPELEEEWETKKATVKLDKERVDLAEKVVKVAEADVKAADANLSATRAILDQYQSQVDRWDSEVKRLKREVERGIVDPQVLLESENQFRSNKSARDAAKANILKAEADLLSKQATEKQDEVAVHVASANLSVAESEAKRLEALVGYLVLPAPFDGMVTVRNANTGDFVLPATGDPTAMQRSPLQSSTGASPVYVVERTDVVRVFVDIPEHDANFVQKGTKATVLIRAFRDQLIPGEVTRTSWALNVKSRTLRAEIDLPNTNGQMLPGMYAYGKVIIERPKVTALPVSCISSIGDKTYYWRYENGKAMKTEIQTGVSDGTWTEVTNRRLPGADGSDSWVPLDGSEKVIACDDLSALSEGDPVRLGAATENGDVAAVQTPH